METLPKQDLTINIDNKQNFGEVHTPYSLIENMFSMLPSTIFSDPNKKWLDPGAGRGFFSLFLHSKLMNGLSTHFPDPKQRSQHILENMIWMVEINQEHLVSIQQLFSLHSTNKLNLINQDFLTCDTLPVFDVVIGNPPFNFGGLKKVPTNSERNKKMDGRTIWSEFIKHSISHLKHNGLLLFIVPSIWMKEDKPGMYFYMTQYKLHKIHCLTNTEMNKYFKGHAQTPSCFFLLEKKSTDKKVLLYDEDIDTYVEFPMRPENIIPVKCANIITQILPYVDKYGSLSAMIKSNLAPKEISLSATKTKSHTFPNIKTTVLKDKIQPELVIEYSNKPCPFFGKTKLVMAHGMYGFPYIDREGIYGISNRDKYIYLSDNISHLTRLAKFLSTPLVFHLFNATRYRMKYLEKYIFSYLPNILAMREDEVAEMIAKFHVPKNKYRTIT
jgi:16S rRNA G966 N2-methylase RsmD